MAQQGMQQTLSTRLILSIGQAILAADSLESTVTIILDAARRLTGAETAGLYQLDDASGLLTCTHATGRDAARMTGGPAPLTGEGVAGAALMRGEPVWTA